MTNRVVITIESSRFAPGAYWVPGAEYYAEDVELVVADGFDAAPFSDGELLDMAENGNCALVEYLHLPEDVEL